MAMALRPPPSDELVEKILLRLPTDDPASLLRAALACKRWARLVSGPGFRARFRDFHPAAAPPMLGFFCDHRGDDDDDDDGDGDDGGGVYLGDSVVSRFVPTSSFRTPWRDRRGWRAVDSRHGRVLIYPRDFRFKPFGRVLTVWNPITGEEQRLPEVPRAPVSWSAAVLCAAAVGTCDHHPDCHRGPFSVVLVGTDGDGLFSCVYSSVDGAWSEPASVEHPDALTFLEIVPAVLVGNALYFLFQSTARILRFDLGSRQVSVIQRPPECADDYQGRPLLMSMEDGRLGFASVHMTKLYLWPGEVDADGEAIWAQSRVIELGTLLRGGLPFLLGFGFTDGVAVIFVWTIGDGVSILNLNPLHVMGSVGTDMDIYGAIPYVSYYIPALRIAAEDGRDSPSASA